MRESRRARIGVFIWASAVAGLLLRCTKFSSSAENGPALDAATTPDEASVSPGGDDGGPLDGGDGWRIVFEDSFDQSRPNVTSTTWTERTPDAAALSLANGGAPGSTPRHLLVTADPARTGVDQVFHADMFAVTAVGGTPSEAELSFMVRPDSDLSTLATATQVVVLSFRRSATNDPASLAVGVSLERAQAGVVQVNATATLNPCPDAGTCQLMTTAPRRVPIGVWTSVVLRATGLGAANMLPSVEEADASLLPPQPLVPTAILPAERLILYAGIVYGRFSSSADAAVSVASLDAFRLRVR